MTDLFPYVQAANLAQNAPKTAGADACGARAASSGPDASGDDDVPSTSPGGNPDPEADPNPSLCMNISSPVGYPASETSSPSFDATIRALGPRYGGDDDDHSAWASSLESVGDFPAPAKKKNRRSNGGRRRRIMFRARDAAGDVCLCTRMWNKRAVSTLTAGDLLEKMQRTHLRPSYDSLVGPILQSTK